MPFLLAFLFSISSNLDNFVIGVSYGLKEETIGWSSNVIISLITTLITYLSMAFGQYLLHWVPNTLANILGAVIFVAMGIWFILSDVWHHNTDKPDQPDTMTWQRAIGVGFLLSVNNIGIGILGSVAGLHIITVLWLTFITCLLLTYVGNNIGDHVIGRFIGQYNDRISGGLLILLGIGSLWL